MTSETPLPPSPESEAAPDRRLPPVHQASGGAVFNRAVLAAGLLLALPLLGVLFANLGRDPHSVGSPMVGRPAPSFSLRPVGGGAPVALADLKGRPVVVNFWATWCGPCIEEHPALVEGAKQAGDAQFLGVVYEDEESRIQGFLGERGKAYPTLMDGDGRAAIAYGVYGVPETFFIDRSGTIVAKHVGPLDPETLAGYLRKAGAK